MRDGRRAIFQEAVELGVAAWPVTLWLFLAAVPVALAELGTMVLLLYRPQNGIALGAGLGVFGAVVIACSLLRVLGLGFGLSRLAPAEGDPWVLTALSYFAFDLFFSGFVIGARTLSLVATIWAYARALIFGTLGLWASAALALALVLGLVLGLFAVAWTQLAFARAVVRNESYGEALWGSLVTLEEQVNQVVWIVVGTGAASLASDWILAVAVAQVAPPALGMGLPLALAGHLARRILAAFPAALFTVGRFYGLARIATK